MAFCPQCLAQYRDGFTECSDCKVPLVDGRPQQARHTQQASKSLEGVRGWLLFFVIRLIVIGPVWNLTTILEIPRSGIGDPVIGLLWPVLLLGLSGFSVYTGFSIAAEKPKAIYTAKLYLLCELACSILLGGYILFYVPLEGITTAITAVLVFAVWYSYLERSERVRQTFGIPPKISTIQPRKFFGSLEEVWRNRRNFILKTAVGVLLAVGLGVLLLAATANLRNSKSKSDGRLYRAVVYSHNTDREYNVEVKFEGKNVTIYFFDSDFVIWGARKRIPKGGFLTTTLDSEEITDPKNVRVLDEKHNIFLYLNITDPNFLNR